MTVYSDFRMFSKNRLVISIPFPHPQHDTLVEASVLSVVGFTSKSWWPHTPLTPWIVPLGHVDTCQQKPEYIRDAGATASVLACICTSMISTVHYALFTLGVPVCLYNTRTSNKTTFCILKSCNFRVTWNWPEDRIPAASSQMRAVGARVGDASIVQALDNTGFTDRQERSRIHGFVEILPSLNQIVFTFLFWFSYK